MPAEHILLVEDDVALRGLLKAELEDGGYHVDDVGFFREAHGKMGSGAYTAVVLDLKLPDGNGLDLFEDYPDKLRNRTIVITANASIANAVEAIRKGAFNYVEKPFPEGLLNIQIRKIVELDSLRRSAGICKKEVAANFSFRDIICESSEMREVIDRAKVLSETDNTILIEGETGVGKEILSQSIHNGSRRQSNVFLPVNCAAIPPDLVESELFGFKRGAFTGATENYSGRFIQADKGTLFLDEIGDLPLHVQAKLLRVLDNGMVYQLKGGKPQRIDIRIIAATNKDLAAEIKAGCFRKDLYFRLQESVIYIPPLRERPDDIMPLFRDFLRTYNSIFNKKVDHVTTKAERFLVGHDWEGNVRELKNLLKSIVPFKNNDTIDINDVILPLKHHARAGGKKCKTLAEYGGEYVREVYHATGFNKRKALELLGISLPTLNKYLKD